MIVSVVAVGDTAQDWHKTPCDLSIACNDAFKFGAHPDWIVLVNAPHKFHKRLDVIRQTKPKRVFTNLHRRWVQYFPEAERLTRLVEFTGRLRVGTNYTCRTSPMICISLALTAGATDIILWGLDMKNHKTFREGTKSGDNEIKLYIKFFEEIQKIGVKIWRGANGSVFDSVIPLYETLK
jgi:hypothetical protein